jgi:TrkA domain protein
MRCSKSDPDTCHEVLRLTKEDARTLAELLGQSQVTEEVTAMRLSMRGLDIDWLPVGNDAQCAHCSLHDLKHQDDDSAAIVAVLRGESTIAGPPSTFVLEPGDIAVAVGTPSGIEKLGELLSDR